MGYGGSWPWHQRCGFKGLYSCGVHNEEAHPAVHGGRGHDMSCVPPRDAVLFSRFTVIVTINKIVEGIVHKKA